MWQGWADDGIPPTGTIDYYETLAKSMGGYTATQQFARLFLFPTVYHCGGGYGGVSSADLTLVTQLVQWVGQGAAPGQVGATPDVASSFHAVISPNANQYVTWTGNHLFDEPLGTGPPSHLARSSPR